MQFRAFPEWVSPQILLLERVDNFGTSEHFSGLKKKNLNQQRLTGWVLKLSLHVNESCDEPVVYFQQ